MMNIFRKLMSMEVSGKGLRPVGTNIKDKCIIIVVNEILILRKKRFTLPPLHFGINNFIIPRPLTRSMACQHKTNNRRWRNEVNYGWIVGRQ